VKQVKYPNIEAERARLGLSKDEFAKKLGIATKTYYNWLNGVNPIPSDVLMEMARMSNSTMDYLMGLSKEKGA
jgi:transcriptional regulator with XRE-family HTH domain